MRHIGLEAHSDWGHYLPLLLYGTLLFVLTFVNLKLYSPRLLLRPEKACYVVMRGTFFWFLLFLGTSLIFKFEPAISRLFVTVSCATSFLCMVFWRKLFFFLLEDTCIQEKLVQRIIIIGWDAEASRLFQEIQIERPQPYKFAGVVATAHSTQPSFSGCRVLGDLPDLEQIVTEHKADIVVVADINLGRDELLGIATLCERCYIDFKIIPSFFQIFLSNLQMQTLASVPILGVDSLPIHNISNQFMKRAVDTMGALVGLLGSIPIMLVLIWMIRRESPGPVFYRQQRVGRHGQPFNIYKLRSMRLDAESATGALWAMENDPRRLKIGAFMREWNLDELPQFWNVIKGDMSLVGPRPERPELIAQFEREIAHYNPRHEMRPGMTGWAQVNGLRGNTSLVERIRYDLYYIENWSIWFDVQILFLTFVHRENAY
jgi:exopolysaccharide biosynthesis polyprenyl glycosylphosphotransferase